MATTYKAMGAVHWKVNNGWRVILSYWVDCFFPSYIDLFMVAIKYWWGRFLPLTLLSPPSCNNDIS